MVSVVSTLALWISCPLSRVFTISFDYYSLNLLFKNDFATLLIAKSNDWITWVRFAFASMNTVTQWFWSIKSKTHWVHWAIQTSKMSMHFCSSSRSNSPLFDLANRKTIDSRCSMTLSSLLQWFFVWVMSNPSGNSVPVGNNGWFYLGKIVALVRIFQNSKVVTSWDVISSRYFWNI